MKERARTLIDILLALRESPAKVVFPGRGVLRHRDLPDQADRVAALLRAAGVQPGEVVGLAVSASPEWLAAFFGVIRLGAAVTVLPVPPVSVDPAAAARHLQPIAATARLRHVVAGGPSLRVAKELAMLSSDLVVVDVDETAVAADGPWPAPDERSLAIVQFSSGSTSRPKGVKLAHETVVAGVRGINAHLSIQPSDVLVQWVPLFHDMGLISLLCALDTPNDAHWFSQLAFMRDPGAVLRYIADVGGSIVGGPNFSYEKFAEVAEGAFREYGGDRAQLPLARWRVAVNGAEMVHPQTVRAFQETFRPLGVGHSVMLPCYGMAEATLAITMPRLGTSPRYLTVDRGAVIPGEPVRRVPANSASARTLTSVGVPIPGMAVRIADLDGQSLPAGFLGEILIQGPAVTTGYLHNEPATHALIRDGWLHTGDLGFQDGDELFIAGRLKEMIVVRGRNFFPDDIEEAVRHLPGIFRQHCLAVADPAEERIVVVAEAGVAAPRRGESSAFAADELKRKIRSTVATVTGLPGVGVVLVPPRTLPRTTSGKWQRVIAAELAAERSA